MSADSPSAPPLGDDEVTGDVPVRFILGMCFLFLVAAPGFFTLWKFNRADPQSTRFVIALIGRRVLQPLLDVMLDISAMISYASEGETTSALVIGLALVLGSLSMSIISAYTASKTYKALPQVPHSIQHMGIGCLAGVMQVGPAFLGWRTVQAWREITDHPRWRRDPGTVTTQAELEGFVQLVADMKNGVHFESLFEGGPQFALQTYLLVYQWESVGPKLGQYDLGAWLRIFSPMFSAAGLIMSQMDFLCENDRFCHQIWRRDKPVVMLCTMNDLLSQLVLRVIPLSVLLDHQLWMGLTAIVLGLLYAITVTFLAQKEEDMSDQSCFDSGLVSILFAPHAFFFGMTYFAGHHKSTKDKVDPKHGRPFDFNTVERSLLTFRGFTLTFVHLIASLIMLIVVITTPHDTERGGNDPQGRRQFMWTVSIIALSLLLVARSALWSLQRFKQDSFDADASFAIREPPTFNKYTSFEFGRPTGGAGGGLSEPSCPPPSEGQRRTDFEASEILNRRASKPQPPPPAPAAPPRGPAQLASLEANENVARFRAQANLGPVAEIDWMNATSVDATQVELESGRGSAAGGCGGLSIVIDASSGGAASSGSPAASAVDSAPSLVSTSTLGTPGHRTSVEQPTSRGDADGSAGVGASSKPVPAWKKYAQPRGSVARASCAARGSGARPVRGSCEPGADDKPEPAWKKYARPRGSVVASQQRGSLEGRQSKAAGGAGSATRPSFLRLSAERRSASSPPVPPAATPQAAAFAAALAAWPAMPEKLQHLPLSMALEEDPRDDPATRGHKSAARKAADAAIKELRAQQDAKLQLSTVGTS